MRKSIIPVNECDGRVISLNEAINLLKGVKYGYQKLIEATFNGEINPCSEIEGTGLQRFCFDKDQIDAFVNEKVATINNGAISLIEAAKKLQVKERVLRFWARNNLLKADPPKVTGQRWWSISDEALITFTNKYALAAPIARFHSMSPEKFVRTAQQAGIIPVSGASVDDQRDSHPAA